MNARLTARVRALLAARAPERPGSDERRAAAALGYSPASPRSIAVAPVNQARPPGGGRAHELDEGSVGPEDTAA